MKKKFEINPDYIFCLDGGVPDDERLYSITSTKGVLDFDFRVQTLSKEVHSGLGSGIVADSFRILMDLIDKMESVETGGLVSNLESDIPLSQYTFMREFYKEKNEKLDWKFPKVKNIEEIKDNKFLGYLNRSWKP